MQYTKVSRSTTLKFNELFIDVKIHGLSSHLIEKREDIVTGNGLLENDDIECIYHTKKAKSHSLKLQDKSTSAILEITASNVTTTFYQRKHDLDENNIQPYVEEAKSENDADDNPLREDDKGEEEKQDADGTDSAQD